MKDGSPNVTAPALGLTGHGETEILSAVTWLWRHSLKPHSLPLVALSETFLAPLKTQQTVLLLTGDWNSGDRRWIADWVTPSGHAPHLSRIVQTHLSDSCLRALYHCGVGRGKRVKAMRGDHMWRADADARWHGRPLPISVSNIRISFQ